MTNKKGKDNVEGHLLRLHFSYRAYINRSCYLNFRIVPDKCTPTYTPGAEGGHRVAQPVAEQTLSDTLQPGLRRSSRSRRPTWRYRERDIDSPEDLLDPDPVP